MILATFLGVHSLSDVLQAIVNGVINGSGYALLGISWGLIYGIARRFHYALALTYTLAAFIASVVASGSGVSLLPAILIGLAVSVICGMLIELFGYQGLTKKIGAAALMPIFVVSIGITIAGTNALQLIWGAGTRTLNGFSVSNITVGSVTFTTLEVSLVVVALILSAATDTMLAWTPLGRQMKAVRSNPDMALAVGINPNRIYLVVFAVGSFLAGVAAVYEGMRFAVTADMGTVPLFYALVVSFLVGTARTPMVVWASGMFVGLVESLSTLWISPHYTSVVVFVILLVFVSWRSLRAGIARSTGVFAAVRRPFSQLGKARKTA